MSALAHTRSVSHPLPSSFSSGQTTSAPTKARRRQTGTPWTRSGCLTCKKRRKGCDKAKPSCNNCIKQGRTCEGYGSLWVEPLGPSAQVFKQTEQSKRRRLSVSIPLSSPQYTGRWLDENSSSSSVASPSRSVSSSQRNTDNDPDIEELDPSWIRNRFELDQNVANFNSLAVIPRPNGYTSHLSDRETHYLQYHIEQGSQLLANLENVDNPLRSLLVPRAMSSPLLMKAVCALSALHLANRSQGFGAQTAATKFYGSTLSALRTALVECPPDLLPDDTMLAVGLLCKYEVVRGSVKQWVVHLDALQRLIISRGGFGSMDREAGEFLRGLYVYAYNMARITHSKRIAPVEDHQIDDGIGIPSLDIYIGYTEEILKVCGRIAELPSLKDDPLALRAAITSINAFLSTWSHTTTRCVIPQTFPADTLTRLQLVAECFRDAAFIYLHSILEHMDMAEHSPCNSGTAPTQTTNDPDPPINSAPHLSELTPLISIPKSIAVDRCLTRVQFFPLDQHCEYSALTFPLFIAGCESAEAVQREVVLRSLDRLQDSFGIGNVLRAKEVLRTLWMRWGVTGDDSADADVDADNAHLGDDATRRKVHWLDILEELQWGLILA